MRNGDALVARLIAELENAKASEVDVLRKLYDGRINPEDSSFDKAPEFKPLSRKLSEASQAMCRFTEHSPELEKAFDRYTEAYGDVSDLIAQEQFVEGFALAIKLIMEPIQKP